jgi:hypothetical protein
LLCGFKLAEATATTEIYYKISEKYCNREFVYTVEMKLAGKNKRIIEIKSMISGRRIEDKKANGSFCGAGGPFA